MTTIASGLGREASTICLEVARNSTKSAYRALFVGNRAVERACICVGLSPITAEENFRERVSRT